MMLIVGVLVYEAGELLAGATFAKIQMAHG